MTHYPRGTKGFCLSCDAHLFTLDADKKQGDPVSTADLDQTQGQAPWIVHDKCICKKCGAYFNFNHAVRWELP